MATFKRRYRGSWKALLAKVPYNINGCVAVATARVIAFDPDDEKEVASLVGKVNEAFDRMDNRGSYSGGAEMWEDDLGLDPKHCEYHKASYTRKWEDGKYRRGMQGYPTMAQFMRQTGIETGVVWTTGHAGYIRDRVAYSVGARNRVKGISVLTEEGIEYLREKFNHTKNGGSKMAKKDTSTDARETFLRTWMSENRMATKREALAALYEEFPGVSKGAIRGHVNRLCFEPWVTREKSCPQCGTEATGNKAIRDVFGLRYGGNSPQSWCKACRTEAVTRCGAPDCGRQIQRVFTVEIDGEEVGCCDRCAKKHGLDVDIRGNFEGGSGE